MKTFLMSLCTCLLTGCVGTKDMIAPNLQVIDIPTLGETKTVELGDTLVSKGKIYSYDAIRLENTVTAGDGIILKKFTIEPGILLADMKDSQGTPQRIPAGDGVKGYHP